MTKPRTIILTDPELDDLNSLIRLLLHSNELEIEGLIYASSRYHWKGDDLRARKLVVRETNIPGRWWCQWGLR